MVMRRKMILKSRKSFEAMIAYHLNLGIKPCLTSANLNGCS